MITDSIKVTDKQGFVYSVIVKHHPEIGLSIAYYVNRQIASREYGRINPPLGDDDNEWTQWQENFMEGTGGDVTSDLEYECKLFFDNAGN